MELIVNTIRIGSVVTHLHRDKGYTCACNQHTVVINTYTAK